ncbi:molybdopterin molybdenumtransferase MoeA [Sulfitobacter sp. SK012]|uniref:molybdopterin-binding protein n=1 Tax=Sulfitobacter sp. SK012 TaxID=1389005 RepID=UPI000E0C61D2|nr:gephyrin-like molybdotransferase Glp [Sulfitobacter sp. SK012]AXI45317.1 molybdopterin molybdenumtransferase MoeA [Sulfitobacter sp. SK012]
MKPFDTVLIVDWSGGNDTGPKPRKDAIWAGVVRNGVADAPVYLRNRVAAEIWIAAFLEVEIAAGRRVFAGFDFSFGYPVGFAKALTGQDDPLVVWDWFEARIEDAPETNNRFDLAGEINSTMGGKGPFWANGLGRDIDGLPRRKDHYYNPFPDRREAEQQAKGTFTCWQMAGAGAVGSQTFMGLPVLARLRRQFAKQVRVWPFEPLHRDVAFVEIWPSLTVGPAPEGQIKDSWQVSELASQIAALDADDLGGMLDVEAPREGAIFGVGFEDALRGGLRLRNDCFALPRGVHWTPVDDALDLLQGRLRVVVREEKITLSAALGRVSSHAVEAKRANPPLANTAVDGYGFAGGRGPSAHQIPLVSGRAAAGDAPGAVPDGQAIRVLTGAALPEGVDTVILQEDVTVSDGAICFTGPLKQGANTRRAGEDVGAGDQVLAAGRRITASDLALLAATDVSEIVVRVPLRVGVLSTGDELVEPGEIAHPGQIYDANRPMLLGLLAQMGHDPVDLGRAPDNRDTLRHMLDDAAGKVDAILTSGGASAGDEDHVSALLSEAGAMTLWRIAIKPGRPLALGVWDGIPVFGLPGNPVAAMVCTLLFTRPALAVMAGEDWPSPQGFDVPAAFEKRKKPGRREYLRARMRDGKIEAFPSEGSGRISGLSWAEGLVELSEEARDIAPGDMVRFIPYASFGI